MIPVIDIFRVQAGCQVCGQDLNYSTEQGAEKQPEIMSDWDVTSLGLLPRARAHLLGTRETTSVLGRELSLSDLDTRAPKKVGSAFPQA